MLQKQPLRCAPGLREDKRSFSRRTKCRSGARDPLPREHSALNKAEPAGTWRGRTFNHCTRTASEKDCERLTPLIALHHWAPMPAALQRPGEAAFPSQRGIRTPQEVAPRLPLASSPLLCWMSCRKTDALGVTQTSQCSSLFSPRRSFVSILKTRQLCPGLGHHKQVPQSPGPSSRCRPSTATEASSDSVNVCEEETFTTEARLEVI